MSAGGVSAESIKLEARRLEELALNASGAFQSLLYDGWLLGFRPGPTKRLRCVNAFYSTSLPLAEKVDYCVRFYRSLSLPAIFRMLPFSQPPELDAYLESLGWSRFERTLILRADVQTASQVSEARDSVEIIDVARWQEAAAGLLDLAGAALSAAIERAKAYPCRTSAQSFVTEARSWPAGWPSWKARTRDCSRCTPRRRTGDRAWDEPS